MYIYIYVYIHNISNILVQLENESSRGICICALYSLLIWLQWRGAMHPSVPYLFFYCLFSDDFTWQYGSVAI